MAFKTEKKKEDKYLQSSPGVNREVRTIDDIFRLDHHAALLTNRSVSLGGLESIGVVHSSTRLRNQVSIISRRQTICQMKART